MTLSGIKNRLNPYKQILPLILLSGFVLDALLTMVIGTTDVSGEVFEYTPSYKNYLGMGALVLNVFVYRYFRSFYKYSLVSTLFVGLFGIIIFSAVSTKIGINFGRVGIKLEVTSLLTILLTYMLNFDRANFYIINFFSNSQTPEQLEKYQKAKFDEEVEVFREKFRLYPDESLIAILEASKFVPEAKEAARQLLAGKINKEKS